MKKLRILVPLLVLACAPALASCRTTVAGPSYVVRVVTQGATPIQISSVDTLELVWDPHNPALHFLPEPDMEFDGGIMTHITTTSTEGGDFIVRYPASFVMAHATPSSLGFQIQLPFYSRDADAGTGTITPLVTARILDASATQIASGAAYAVWPLVGGNSVQVTVTCDMFHEADCNPP